MTVLKIPKGLFLEKSKTEASKIWLSLKESLDALLIADPFYGKSFYGRVYYKQEQDGTQNRHAYIQVCTVRPQALPDSALFKIMPKKQEYHLCYSLPAMEHMSAYKDGGALANKLIADWIKAFEQNTLSDPTDHDFSADELYMMLSGQRYGKTQEEMQAALQGKIAKFQKV